MANYESALTGQQMDAALTEVALYNPEAWAVGTRNGVNVTSADETYHNNAKYYAQVAQSAIPGTYTAAVRWDIAQGLAGEAQEQARANISAGASNRNLLDNPWWGSGEVVNQRGFTSGSTAHNVYCIDRWKTSYGSAAGTISLGANGLTITAASGTYALINQVIDNYAKLTGKTVTCSAMLSNGTIVSGTIANLNWDASPIAVTSGNVRLQMLGQGYFRVTILNGGSATIRAVKLELGSYSTLANDVPPKLREARADCQERFLRVKSSSSAGIVGFGSQTQSDRAYILIPTPVTMELNSNNTMSATLTGTARLVGNGSGSINVTSVSFISKEENGVLIACFGSNIAANVTYNLYLTSGSYIDISGDL